MILTIPVMRTGGIILGIVHCSVKYSVKQVKRGHFG